jgi:hypothetical protein
MKSLIFLAIIVTLANCVEPDYIILSDNTAGESFLWKLAQNHDIGIIYVDFTPNLLSRRDFYIYTPSPDSYWNTYTPWSSKNINKIREEIEGVETGIINMISPLPGKVQTQIQRSMSKILSIPIRNNTIKGDLRFGIGNAYRLNKTTVKNKITSRNVYFEYGTVVHKLIQYSGRFCVSYTITKFSKEVSRIVCPNKDIILSLDAAPNILQDNGIITHLNVDEYKRTIYSIAISLVNTEDNSEKLAAVIGYYNSMGTDIMFSSTEITNKHILTIFEVISGIGDIGEEKISNICDTLGKVVRDAAELEFILTLINCMPVQTVPYTTDIRIIKSIDSNGHIPGILGLRIIDHTLLEYPISRFESISNDYIIGALLGEKVLQENPKRIEFIPWFTWNN